MIYIYNLGDCAQSFSLGPYQGMGSKQNCTDLSSHLSFNFYFKQ